ncbi:MAG: hypothetical protein K1X61_03090 [Chitinophagales bacterium]|nr:hypothetical protein [Chitinophagales bacterium]
MKKSLQHQPGDGLSRLLNQLRFLSTHLERASTSPSPARALFLSPARQNTFYLEALARIHRKLHDRNFFNELRKTIKQLEDQLGRVDYYHAFAVEFSATANFPPLLLQYFNTQTESAMQALQQLLEEQQWLDLSSGMVPQLIHDFEKISWMEPMEECKAIMHFLNDEWSDFKKDFSSNKFDFTLLEQGVHEFRRQLRWFSIYAQALQGLIQLKENPHRATLLEKYLTDEILHSPFNKMPATANSLTAIYVSAPDFYAISYVIQAIGTLKDSGLRLHALSEAIVATEMKDENEATRFAARLLHEDEGASEDIARQARTLCSRMMEEVEITYTL